MAGGSPKGSGGGGSDQHGGSHADPMDQYLQLLNSGSQPPDPASVRAVLHQALTNPRVFAGFAELRSVPSVVEALEKSGEGGESALRTLDLFAFGTYGDYTEAEKEGEGGGKGKKYLTLTDAQLHKLRQLTVVSLVQRTAAAAAATASAGKSSRRRGRGRRRGNKSAAESNPYGSCAVPYSSIRSELSLPPDSPVRDLEDLLISCVYAGLLVGRLDQRSMSFLVGPGSAHQPPCAARDVRLGKVGAGGDADADADDDVGRMIEALEAFHKRGEEVAAALGDAADGARKGREEDAERWSAVEKRVKEIRARIRDNQQSATIAGGGGGPEGPSMGGGGDAWGAAVAMDAMGGDAGMAAAAMDISMEGGGSAGARGRQSKRSRGGAYGGEPFGRY